jgi:pimeloyl-ACP methyl ester carboxylesterase
VALHYDPAIARPILAQEAQAVDMTALWSAVGLPVLLIRGAESDILLPQTAAEMAARPNVRLAEVAHAGHAPALMDAAQIALVADFLAQ